MRRPFAPAVVLLAALPLACASPAEERAQIIALDAQWRVGTMAEGSFELMVDAIRSVGDQPKDDPARLAAVPELLRLVIKNPSAWVRREALHAAWHLSAGLPEPAAVREDKLNREEFTAKTAQLEAIVLQDGPVEGSEGLELARWLGQVRAPYEEVELAVSVSEVVVSQSLWRSDALGEAFRENLAGNLQHALALVTLRASTDSYPVVREEALQSVRYLHPDAAIALVAGVLARESDSAVLLAALDSVKVLAPRIDPEVLRQVLEPLQGSTDVAIRLQIRALLGPSAG